MVSLLWKACSEGHLQKVQELLEEPNVVDIELKDYTGVTPLIEAVKNGHVEIVKLLLDKGADPANASKDGRPETYTSEPAILDLLQAAPSKTTPVPPPQSPYIHDASDGTDKHFYAPPPPPSDTYIYYPPSMNEGAVYYLPPSATSGAVSPNNGIGHLPPPEIARMIPCRYFPACRYGSQCIFQHPQGPYYQGAMPPYPPYDPMANPYGHYYPPPPPFQQPPTAHPVPMTSPPTSALHTRSSSDVVSPVQPPFSPNGSAPPSSNYASAIYPHPGQLPMQYPIPQPHPQPPHPDHHSVPNLYDVPPILTPYPLSPDGPYSRPFPNGHAAIGNADESTPTENPTHVNGVNGNHHRRGSMRHMSFGSRKPPCLFFPSGRCKNGDECRFPHILPDGASMSTQPNLSQGKGVSSRASRVSQPDGPGSLADKLSNLNLRDDQRPTSGIEGSGRPHTNENGQRLKSQANGKNHYQPGLNGHAKKSQLVKQQIQRVPNADEFPVLAGSVTPPKLVNGNGQGGLTAAQVLQAPPPARKDSKESSTRGTTPELVLSPSKELTPDTNGHQEKVVPSDHHTRVLSNKLSVVSFAAAAAASPVVSDAVKEVSVSA